MEEKRVAEIEKELDLIRVKLGIRRDGTPDGNGLIKKVDVISSDLTVERKDLNRLREEIRNLTTDLKLKELEITRAIESKAEKDVVYTTLKKGKEWVGLLIFLAILIFGVATWNGTHQPVAIQQQKNNGGGK